jgi:3-oxoacyl-[acyl-carrier-protein] synthase II
MENSARQKRVVVTGIGVISPIGVGVDAFWDNLIQAKSGVDKISQFDSTEMPIKLAAEVKGYDPNRFFDKETIRMNPRYAQFALVASREAIKSSGISGQCDPEQIGIVLGTSAAGLTYSLEQYDAWLKHGASGMDTFLTSIMNNGVAVRAVSLENKFKGLANTFTSTCVASTDAIGYAFEQVRSGKMRAMIAGGAESCICPSTVAGFYLGRILSKRDGVNDKTPCPFDLNRDGTVLGEGSAILVLEEYAHARRRKAKILGEIIGHGSTTDAYHVVQPDPDGYQGARAVNIALKGAGVKKNRVDYINAHGTGTKKNDWAETAIIKRAFGKQAYKIPVSATKSITGHLLGSAGALESVICLLALKYNIIPPTINYKTPDSKCDLDFVPNEARKKKINIAVSNTFGFGGYNSILVFRKYE